MHNIFFPFISLQGPILERIIDKSIHIWNLDYNHPRGTKKKKAAVLSFSSQFIQVLPSVSFFFQVALF